MADVPRRTPEPVKRADEGADKRELKAARRKLKAARTAAKGKRARPSDGPGKIELLLQGLRDELDTLAAGDGRIVVGPFTGEVGFELLYWIPLVRWAVREFPGLDGRLAVVSRGGVAHWWQSFLPVDYVDI